MNIFFAIILGIIQGITEFLPISSTAHLTLAAKLFGFIDPARPEDWTAFIAIMQLGTVAAVIIYFFKDLIIMTRSFFADLLKNKSSNRWTYESKLAWKIILGTIPVVIIGLAFKKFIEGTFTKEISTIATSLIVLALILLLAEKVGKKLRNERQTTWVDAVIVGFAQALALIPGSSRSGTTIAAGLFVGLTRGTAARFSFLLSIPAVLASGFYEMYQARHHFADLGIAPLVISTVVSGIVGYWAISFLLKFLQKHTTYVFIFYRIILGAVLWGLLLTKYF
jgi:undecaprenyl-diphosphatase